MSNRPPKTYKASESQPKNIYTQRFRSFNFQLPAYLLMIHCYFNIILINQVFLKSAFHSLSAIEILVLMRYNKSKFEHCKGLFCLSLDAKLPFLFILTAKPCLFNGFAAIYCRFALCCKALSDSAGGSI